jgi:hypothetical protein
MDILGIEKRPPHLVARFQQKSTDCWIGRKPVCEEATSSTNATDYKFKFVHGALFA